MNKLRSVSTGLVTACALVFSGAGSAWADGPRYNWTGLYFGVGVGASWMNVDNTHSLVGAAAPYLVDQSGGDGRLATLMLGYDHKFGSSLVAGVFVDHDFGRTSSVINDLQDGFVRRGTYELKPAWGAGARIGLLATPSTLFYLTGGWTGAKAGQIDLNNFLRTVSINRHYPSHTLHGAFIGGGMETMFTKNLALRLEYRLANFGDKDLQRLTTSTGAFINTLGNFDVETQSVRAVLSFKFGREEHHEPMK